MALAGNIKEFGLADIFQIISLQQKTGELTVESPEGKVKILVEQGFIVGADATFRSIEERLQQSLARSQVISKFHLKRALETQKKTFQPLWTVLAETRAIDVKTLQLMLSQQIHETVYHVLRWSEGTYSFEPRRSVEYDSELISPINSEFLVMEGFRITDEWSEIEKTIPSLQLLVRHKGGILDTPDGLSDSEMRIFKLLSTERTVQELVDMSQLGEFDTCQTLYELIKKNLIEPVPGKKGKTSKVQRITIGFTDILVRGVAVIAVIALIVGAGMALKYLPENFALIHTPNLKVIGNLRRFATQSYLTVFSEYIPRYYLQQKTLPKSFEELQATAFGVPARMATDSWRQPYVMHVENQQVRIQSPGKDNTLKTADDVQIVIVF
ncbi:MAG: DUF4388 domain-containing protein [Candidatus Vecturithrix sp.]|jgi:hypothetical protein|nr:DUF4388 domain-containing protein [Candidatus Vecturithrix sp.]